MSDDQSTKGDGKSRHRSPKYPAIGLREAVEKLKSLYLDHKRNAVHLDAAYASLNLKGGGYAGRVIAALIMFGFLEDDGSGDNRRVKVSSAGYRFIHLDESDPDRLDALREAARKPTIFADMLTEWPEALPTDQAMQKYLVLSRGFNADAVPSLIQDFRDTYEYANLGQSSILITEPKVADDPRDPLGTPPVVPSGNPPPATLKVPVGMKSFALPLGDDSEIILHYPANLSADDFDFFASMLRRIKRKLIASPPMARTGNAIWANADHDEPVVVTGSLGMRDGKQYMSIEGSATGVPLDELTFTEE